MFAFVGTGELVIILLIVLVVFGSTQLPRLARSLGQAQKEFKKGVSEGDIKEDKEGSEDKEAKGSEEVTEPTETKK